jgi:hypothetical protein
VYGAKNKTRRRLLKLDGAKVNVGKANSHSFLN